MNYAGLSSRNTSTSCSSQPKLRQRFCQMSLQGTAENAHWLWARSRHIHQKWEEKIKNGFLTTELDEVPWELCKCNCLSATRTTPALFKEVMCTLCTHYPRCVLGHLPGQWPKEPSAKCLSAWQRRDLFLLQVVMHYSQYYYIVIRNPETAAEMEPYWASCFQSTNQEKVTLLMTLH